MAADKKDEAESADSPRSRGSPRKGFLLRLSPAMHADLRRWANQEMRSLNGHIEYLLAQALKRRKRKDES